MGPIENSPPFTGWKFLTDLPMFGGIEIEIEIAIEIGFSCSPFFDFDPDFDLDFDFDLDLLSQHAVLLN